MRNEAVVGVITALFTHRLLSSSLLRSSAGSLPFFFNFLCLLASGSAASELPFFPARNLS